MTKSEKKEQEKIIKGFQENNFIEPYHSSNLIKLLSKTNIAKTSVPDSTDIEKFVEAGSCRHNR